VLVLTLSDAAGRDERPDFIGWSLWVFYGVSHGAGPKGGDQAIQKFLQPFSLRMPIVWPRTTQFGMLTHVQRGVFLSDQPRPHLKGWPGPSASTFGCHDFWNRTTTFDMVKDLGKKQDLGSIAPQPKGMGNCRLPIFRLLYVRPLGMTEKLNFASWSN